MIEIETTIKNGLRVIARGTIAPAEPGVGIPNEYCDGYELFRLSGYPCYIAVSRADDNRICEEIVERANRWDDD